MIALLNGVVGGSIDLFKGSNESIKIVLLTDAGAQIDLTADIGGTGSVVLEIYDTEDRRNAAIDTVVCTTGDLTAGYMTAAFVPADLNYGPQTNNAPYWAYVR